MSSTETVLPAKEKVTLGKASMHLKGMGLTAVMGSRYFQKSRFQVPVLGSFSLSPDSPSQSSCPSKRTISPDGNVTSSTERTM